jgi:integrase/recombinase XerC
MNSKFHIQEFCEFIKVQRKLSVKTCEAYSIDLSEFQKYLEIQFQVDSISHVNHRIIRNWISSLLDHQLSARSVNRKISALKTYYKFLLKYDHVQLNPMSKIITPKTEKRLPEFNTESELLKLFELEFDLNDQNSFQDKLMLLLLYSTGLRRSELSNLQLKDVDVYNQTIRVLGKGNKHRIVPVTNEWCKMYSQYLNDFSTSRTANFVFINRKGQKISDAEVYKITKKYLSLVTTKSKKSPHVLRHSFATHMLDNGADLNSIKEILGHSNLAATQVYTHNSIEKLKKSFRQTHPRSGH